MVSKCANPRCSASFRYLHEGRIFSLECPRPEPGLSGWQEPAPHVERYWLCPSCSRDMILVLRNGRVIVQQFPVAAAGFQAA